MGGVAVVMPETGEKWVVRGAQAEALQVMLRLARAVGTRQALVGRGALR